MIVITTPTGQIGRQVLDHVLDNGAAVRVIARDPGRLPPAVRARVEVVTGSHGDADVIATALAGADSVFWLVPPPAPDAPGGAVEHYRDFTRPAARAAADQGVRVVGVTTLGHGYRGRSGVLGAALDMDGRFAAAGVDYRALALPFFMENLLRQLPEIHQRGTFSMAGAADRPFPTVAIRDVAAVAAGLLLDRSWSGYANQPVAGPDTLSPDQLAEIMSSTLGRTVRYRQVTVDDLRAGMRQRGASEAMTRDFAEMVEAQDDGIYDAEPCDPDSATPTGFRQWCQDTLAPALRALG